LRWRSNLASFPNWPEEPASPMPFPSWGAWTWSFRRSTGKSKGREKLEVFSTTAYPEFWVSPDFSSYPVSELQKLGLFSVNQELSVGIIQKLHTNLLSRL